MEGFLLVQVEYPQKNLFTKSVVTALKKICKIHRTVPSMESYLK